MSDKTRIKSMNEVLALLSEHMEALRPGNNPDYLRINAARTASLVVDSYLATVMTCMEYCKVTDQKPDFEFMEIQEVKVK